MNRTGIRKLQPREKRLLVLLLVLLAIAAWKFVPRPWHPTSTLRTAHYVIRSTATQMQTEETARALELLHRAYVNRFERLPEFQVERDGLQVKLYANRKELRWVNPGMGWAEAFYREPYCHAYYSAEEINPYHWMLHEAVHQLNHEVAGLKLVKWLEEGLAEYMSTSRLASNELQVGRIDLNTYPVWWIDEIATSPDLANNLRNGSVVSLRSIITHSGGPSMRRHFNLYYLHWWTLTHFLFEHPEYRQRVLALMETGGGLEAFERNIGPVEKVQEEWHAHVRRLKENLSKPGID